MLPGKANVSLSKFLPVIVNDQKRSTTWWHPPLIFSGLYFVEPLKETPKTIMHVENFDGWGTIRQSLNKYCPHV